MKGWVRARETPDGKRGPPAVLPLAQGGKHRLKAPPRVSRIRENVNLIGCQERRARIALLQFGPGTMHCAGDGCFIIEALHEY